MPEPRLPDAGFVPGGIHSYDLVQHYEEMLAEKDQAYNVLSEEHARLDQKTSGLENEMVAGRLRAQQENKREARVSKRSSSPPQLHSMQRELLLRSQSEKRKVEKKLGQLGREYDKLKQRNHAYEDSQIFIAQLQARIKELEEQAENHEAVASGELRKQLRALGIQIESEKAATRSAQYSLEVSLEIEQKRYGELQSKLEAEQANYKELDEGFDELGADHAKLLDKEKALEESCQEKDAEIDDLRNQLAKAGTNLVAINTAEIGVQTDFTVEDTLATNKQRLGDKVDALEKANTRLQEDAEIATSAKTSAEKESTSLKTERDGLSTQVQSLKEELAVSQKSTSSLENELAEAQKKLASSEDTKNELKVAKQKVADLENVNDQLEETKQKVATLEKVQSELKTTQDKLDDTQDKLSESEKEKNKFESWWSLEKFHREQNGAKLTSCAQDLGKVCKERDEARAEAQGFQQQSTKTSQDLQLCQEKLQDVENQLDQYKSNNSHLSLAQDEVKHWKDMANGFESQAKEARQENENLHSEKADVNAKLAKLESQFKCGEGQFWSVTEEKQKLANALRIEKENRDKEVRELRRALEASQSLQSTAEQEKQKFEEAYTKAEFAKSSVLRKLTATEDLLKSKDEDIRGLNDALKTLEAAAENEMEYETTNTPAPATPTQAPAAPQTPTSNHSSLFGSSTGSIPVYARPFNPSYLASSPAPATPAAMLSRAAKQHERDMETMKARGLEQGKRIIALQDAQEELKGEKENLEWQNKKLAKQVEKLEKENQSVKADVEGKDERYQIVTREKEIAEEKVQEYERERRSLQAQAEASSMSAALYKEKYDANRLQPPQDAEAPEPPQSPSRSGPRLTAVPRGMKRPAAEGATQLQPPRNGERQQSPSRSPTRNVLVSRGTKRAASVSNESVKKVMTQDHRPVQLQPQPQPQQPAQQLQSQMAMEDSESEESEEE